MILLQFNQYPRLKASLMLVPLFAFCLWPSVILMAKKSIFLDAALLIVYWSVISRYRLLLPLLLIPIGLSLVQIGVYLYSGQLIDVYTVMTFTATNIDETMGFIQQLLETHGWLVTIYFISLVLAVYSAVVSPRLSFSHQFLASITLFLVYLLIFMVRQQSLLFKIQVVEQSFYARALSVANEFYRDFHNKSYTQSPIEVFEKSNDRMTDSILIVIGESATTYRMGAYGYARKTTPFLETADTLFTDLVSVGLNTQPNVQAMMTGEVGVIKQIHTQDIFRVAKKSGFNTYYVDNNRFVNRDPMYQIARQSDEYHSINGIGESIPRNDHKIKHDELVLSPFRAMLDKSQGKRRLIFVHLVGSHFNHNLRYPKSFDIFPSHYDNSIRYTDHLLKIMHDAFMASSRGQSALMIYVADHGVKIPPGCGLSPVPVPEVANYTNDERFYTNMSVPLAFWFSPEFKHANVSRVRNLQSAREEPIDQRFLMWTLADMMGVTHINDHAVDDFSLFSPSASFLPRLNSRGKNIDELRVRGDICKP